MIRPLVRVLFRAAGITLLILTTLPAAQMAALGQSPAITPHRSTAPAAQREETVANLAQQIWTGDSEGSVFGHRLAAGDVNSDGRIDLIVSVGQADEFSHVLIFAGVAGGFADEPTWSYIGATSADQTGSAPPVVADLNADGLADLVISAPADGSIDEEGGSTEAGRIDLYLGSSNGPSLTPDWTAVGEGRDALLGTTIASGDVNGDGTADLIAGQVGENEQFSIWFGSPNGLAAAPDQIISGVGAVAATGDFNGDGVSDLFASGTSDEAFDVQIFLGIAGQGLKSEPAWLLRSDQPNLYYDFVIRNVGDVNGDGLDDVLATDAFYPDLDSNGAATLLLGSELVPLETQEVATADADWFMASADLDDFLGWDAAGAGDLNSDGFADVLVSVPGTFDETGSVQIYFGGPTGLSSTPDFVVHGEDFASFLGEALTGVGDVNEDGYDDFVVTAGDYPLGDALGRVYLIYGGPQLESTPPTTMPSTRPAPGPPAKPLEPEQDAGIQWSPAEAIQLTGSETDLGFGWPAIIPGDINGDGLDDLLVNSVGSPTDSIPGRLYVYYGNADGFADTADWEIRTDILHIGPTDDPDSALLFAGLILGRAGDVNGDGFADFAVSTFDVQNEQSHVFVLLGGAEGPQLPPIQLAPPEGEELIFGMRLASPGDINGDGFDEFLVAAMNDPENTMVISLYAGSATGTEPTAIWSIDDLETVEDLGFGLSTTPGDVNGDGYADLLLGAPGYPNGEEHGQAQLYFGGPDGLATIPDWTQIGPAAGDFTGISVVHAGDVNGDGLHDFVVSEPSLEDERGRITLYFGHADGPDALPPQHIITTLEDSAFGVLTVAAGDVDGDSYADLMVGSFAEGDANVVLWQLYLGSELGLLIPPAYEWSIPLVDEELALLETIGAGDLDGDGFNEIVISEFQLSAFLDGDFFLPPQLTIYRGQAAAHKPAFSTAVQWRPSRRQFVDNGGLGEAFGWPAAIVGDVNGDGFDDLAVNSLGNPDIALSGRIVVYYGNPDGVADLPDWQVDSTDWIAAADIGTTSEAVFMGFGVGYAGDLNGDGFHELAATVVDFDAEFSELHIYYGSASGLETVSQRLSAPDSQNLFFGLKASSVGDVNGDGFDDLGLLALDVDGETPTIFVYHGGPDGLDTTGAWTLDTLGGINGFGVGFAPAGDVDRDGYDDLLLGDPGLQQSGQGGQVWLYRGSAEGLSPNTAWSISGISEEAILGLSVSNAGDIDGDGFDDIVVNEPGYLDRGRILVFYGGENAPTSWRRQNVDSPFIDGSSFAILTFPAGDVNGDGFSDLLIATAGSENQQILRWQILLGSSEGLSAEPAFESIAPGDSAEEFLFLQTTHTGDINGDGYADFVLSDIDFATLENASTVDSGAIVYYGGDGSVPARPSTHWTPVDSQVAPESAGAAIANLELVDDVLISHDGVRFHSLSPDGTSILGFAGQQLCILSVATPTLPPRCADWDAVMSSIYFDVITWSPDGRYLALTENSPVFFHDSDIWIFDTVELQFSNLTDDGYDADILVGDENSPPVDLAPVWTPDGSQVIFARSQRVNAEWLGTSLYAVSIADGTVAKIIDVIGGEPLLISAPMHFSLDGTTLYFNVAGSQQDAFYAGIWSLRYDDFAAQQELPSSASETLPRLVEVRSNVGLLYYPVLATTFAQEVAYALWDRETGQISNLTPTQQSADEQRGPIAATLSPDGSKVFFAYEGDGDLYYLEVRDTSTAESKILLQQEEMLGWVTTLRTPVLSWGSTDFVFIGQDADARLLQIGAE